VTQGKGGADDYIAVDIGPDGTPWASKSELTSAVSDGVTGDFR
jgi:hypothetical protein